MDPTRQINPNDPDENLFSNTSSHSGSDHEETNYDEGGYDDGDLDIVVSHDRNSQLYDRPKVKKFFANLDNLKTLTDLNTRRWLGALPLDMWEEAIPLFQDGHPEEDSSVDYQLHPCYTYLELDHVAAQPHPEIFQLSIDGKPIDDQKIVMGIGRLFVNVQTSTGRKSKWTGYEMFVDQDLSLSMAFNQRSLKHLAEGWFPLGCKLSSSPSQYASGEPQEYSHILEKLAFAWAPFLPSLSSIVRASFDEVNTTVKSNSLFGRLKINQLERNDVEKILAKLTALEDGRGGDFDVASQSG